MLFVNEKKNINASIIKRSIFFDEKYVRANSNIPKKTDAAKYYLENWKSMRINPSSIFDAAFYISVYNDVARIGMNPLLHYLLYGWKEVRAPSASFDRAGFLAAHQNIDEKKFDPAACCIMLYGDYNWKSRKRDSEEGVFSRPSPIQYSPISEDVDEACRAIFDADFYTSTYADIDINHVDPYNHFMTFGHLEDRDPAPLFDVSYYRETNLSKDDQSNPLVHFVKNKELRSLETCSPNLELLSPIRDVGPQIPSICLHVHCFYVDLVGEVCKGILNLPLNTFVVATVCSKADAIFVENYFSIHIPDYKFEIREVPNRGRDLGPFLVDAQHIWTKYDLVLHIHTKSSKHVSWGSSWRKYLFDQLLGSKEVVNAILTRFQTDNKLGAYYPTNYYDIKKFIKTNQNSELVASTLKYIGVDNARPGIDEFAAGSMCWYRTKALAPVAEKVNRWELFERETGQVDGTLAHALERVMPVVVKSQKYAVRSFVTKRRLSMTDVPSAPGRDDTSATVTAAWPRDTPRAAKRSPTALAPISKSFNPNALDIHWVVPSFGRGAGGHTTIFRMIKFLEQFGHHQTIWLQNAYNMANQEVARQRVIDWYANIGDKVHVLFLPEDIRQLSGDVIIATDCWTAFPVSVASNFKERFYFVQDLEPEFHPAGANKLVAEATYGFGFSALCAGAWLQQQMDARGLWARQWDLCADHNIYFAGPAKALGKEIQIAFYARPYTDRRAVELGYAAFEQLTEKGIKFCVHLFGEEDLSVSYDFKHIQHGILTHEELADLYRSCDIGVVFSATNYSLIPLEMAACGLAVVELDVPSTRAIFTNDEVMFAEPTPYGIAFAIEKLFNNPKAAQDQCVRAQEFVGRSSWEQSARKIEAALIERLTELNFRPVNPAGLALPAVTEKTKASIFIPTFNAGPEFQQVLDATLAQECDFKFEVLVIDSDSTDDTADRVRRLQQRGVRLESIDKSSFQHGRTRNLGISMAEGDFVAILTQDALPKGTRWLASLLGGFSRGDRVAGVTGRHEAYPSHGPFVARDMTEHFNNLALLPSVLDLDVGLPSNFYPGGMTWRMLMNFYSDNNSAISKSVWKEVPYPEIEWGEDYVWAATALKAGFQKVYANDAVVFHSHDFNDSLLLKTAFAEGKFWGDAFGIRLYNDEQHTIDALNARDAAYASKLGIAKSIVSKRFKANGLLVKGRLQGYAGSIGKDNA